MTGRVNKRTKATATDQSALVEIGSGIVHQDGILLDERRWDEWLALYVPDCTFWVPMWRDETEVNDGTDNALSHFFYESRKGLEDRLVRIRSGRSPASTPLPRTAHLFSSIVLLDAAQPDTMTLRATWACHVLLMRARAQHVFFGRSEYQLASTPAGWRIRQKKVILQNDDIPSLLDIYCV